MTEPHTAAPSAISAGLRRGALVVVFILVGVVVAMTVLLALLPRGEFVTRPAQVIHGEDDATVSIWTLGLGGGPLALLPLEELPRNPKLLEWDAIVPDRDDATVLLRAHIGGCISVGAASITETDADASIALIARVTDTYSACTLESTLAIYRVQLAAPIGDRQLLEMVNVAWRPGSQ